jgi:hypothetical protein
VVLGGFGLVLVASGFGAALMWRVVHLPSLPPALPVWVSSLLMGGGAFGIVAAVVAGQWLGVVGAALVFLTFLIQFVTSIRGRSASSQ